jgi:hypothetical protein
MAQQHAGHHEGKLRETLKGDLMSRGKVLVSRLVVAVLLLVAPTAAFAFSCYCNGSYIGEYKTILGCYNACKPSRSADSLSQMRAQLFGSPLCGAQRSAATLPDLTQ